MRLALISDAWQPQVNGVVTTLVELIVELEKLGYRAEVIHPGLFRTRPCPGYPGIDLAIRPKNTVTSHFDEASAGCHSYRYGRSSRLGSPFFMFEIWLVFYFSFSYQISRDF